LEFEKVTPATSSVNQWCTGSEFGSPIPPDISILWIWLAWISLSIHPDPDSVYPHELNCGDAKKLCVK